MFLYVLPIEVILFQLLTLALAIAVEAEVFYDRFSLTRRQTLEYALLLNLFSTIASWVAFFILQWLLPEFLRLELISYIFLNRLYRGVEMISIPSILMICWILNFIFVCIVEFAGTFILQDLALSEAQLSPPETKVAPSVSTATKGKHTRMETLTLMTTALVARDPNKFVAVLTANIISNGLIFIFFCCLGLLR